MRNFEQEIKKGGYQRIINIAENVLLRPNDTKLLFGEEKYNAMVAAYEKILEEDYKEDDIYKYYRELPKVKHGFCGFERWKRGYLF